MSDLWDDIGEEESPICGYCGVSMLPPAGPGEPQSCENADCEAFGSPVDG